MIKHSYIQKFYYRFINIGITEDLSFSEKLRVELSNQFIFIALPAAIFSFIYNLFSPNFLQEFLLTTAWIVILSIPLLLNYFQKYLFARLYIIAIPVALISTIYLFFGWSLRVDFLYPMFILMSYFILEKRMARIVTLIILFVYAYVNFHLSNYPAPLASQISPVSTYIYFSFATLVTIILAVKVILKNQGFNNLIIAQNKILEEQNRELERFTYIASHDLKSPLSNIIGFSDLMGEELQATDNQEVLEYLSYIHTSSKQMYYLIEDILELSKIQEGQHKKRVLIDLNQIAEKATYALTQEIQHKNAQINCQDLPLFRCNEMEFTLLFQNLIQNGIKYNQNATPTIRIWAEQEPDSICLYFKDNGIGISEEHHSEIFEYFHRLNPSNQYEGTGIGLGLCKKIVQSYNGTISVESTLTQDSTFIIQLPISQASL